MLTGEFNGLDGFSKQHMTGHPAHQIAMYETIKSSIQNFENHVG